MLEHIFANLGNDEFTFLVFIAVFLGVFAIGGTIVDKLESRKAPKRNYRERTGRNFA